MTAIRTSIAFALEEELGKGPKGGKWLAAPPNSFVTHAHRRSVNRQNSAGSKMYDYMAYGGYHGTWSWSYTADYRYLEPWLAVFEVYTHKTITAGIGGTAYPVDSLSTAYSVTTLEGDTLPSEPAANTIYITTTNHPESGEVTGYYGNVYNDTLKKWCTFEIMEHDMAIGKNYLRVLFLHDGVFYENVPTSAGIALPGTKMLAFYTSTRTGTDGKSKVTYFGVDDHKVTVTDDVAYLVSSTGAIEKYGTTGGKYEHVFKKCNSDRVKSFCFRRLQLNKMAGGKTGDEILEVYGAVCTEFRLSMEAGSSQMQVNMSGFSTKEAVKLTNLDNTEYVPYDGEHVMFACLFGANIIGDVSEDGKVIDATKAKDPVETYVANVQTLQVAIKNNVERLWSTCSPAITNYYEGITNYEITVNIYSTNPLFRNRLYTGGQDPTSDMTSYATAVVEDASGKSNTVEYLSKPLCKGLLPMDAMTISSYDTCRDMENGQDIGSTMGSADYRLDILSKGIVFKQMTWDRGDSSKIMDNLTSAECKEMIIRVWSDIPDYSEPADDRYVTINQANMIS